MTQAEEKPLLRVPPHATAHLELALVVVLQSVYTRILCRCTAPRRRPLRAFATLVFVLAAPSFLVKAPLPLPVEESCHAVKRNRRSRNCCGGYQPCGFSDGRWLCTAATVMLTAPGPLSRRPSTQEHRVGWCVIRIAVVCCGSL